MNPVSPTLPESLLDSLAGLEEAASALPPSGTIKLIGGLEELRVRLLLRLQADAARSSAAVRRSAEPGPDAERPLNVKEAAARLNRSADWVYSHKKEIPHVRMGRRGIAFTEAGLRRYLQRNQTGG